MREEIDNKIITLYKEGKRIFEIEKEINSFIKHDAIRTVLQKAGIYKRRNTKFKYDMDKLLNLHKTKEGWYFLGVLLADGSVGERPSTREGSVHKKVSWEIEKKDEKSLVKVCDYFLDTYHVCWRKNRPMCSVHIANNDFVNYLAQFGVQANKRQVAMPALPDCLFDNKDFLLSFFSGYMDGDGCISIGAKDKGVKLNVTCATPIWPELKKVIDKLGFTYADKANSSGTYVSVGFNNPRGALKILMDVYSSNELVFDRRKNRLKEVIELTLESATRYNNYGRYLKQNDPTGWFTENV